MSGIPRSCGCFRSNSLPRHLCAIKPSSSPAFPTSWSSHLGDQTADLSDDEYIEADRLLPAGHATSLMVGFSYISRLLHRESMIIRLTPILVMGHILQMRRSDRRSPPSGISLALRLEEVMGLYRMICQSMDHCPKELKLDNSNG